MGSVTYRSTAVETCCEETGRPELARVSVQETPQRGEARGGGAGEDRSPPTHHDSPCAASCWGSCGRRRRQAHADRGPWPRSRTWGHCPRSRWSSPWLRLPSLSSGRGSHWVSWLRNGRRVRSSFEQGRRLLAGIGDDSMAVPTQRLLLWVAAWCCCRRRVYQDQDQGSCCAVPPASAGPAAVPAAVTAVSAARAAVAGGWLWSARVALSTVASAAVAIVAGWV